MKFEVSHLCSLPLVLPAGSACPNTSRLRMSPWKRASASKVVKSLLQQAVKMYGRSAAAAHPFTKNKCSCYVLVGNFSSAVKNQSIKGWHSCYIHTANAFIFTWLSSWLMDSTSVQRKLKWIIQFGKLGTENKDNFFISECGPVMLTQSAYNCVYLFFIYSLSAVYLLTWVWVCCF